LVANAGKYVHFFKCKYLGSQARYGVLHLDGFKTILAHHSVNFHQENNQLIAVSTVSAAFVSMTDIFLEAKFGRKIVLLLLT
jgi:hypothetical protein